MLTRTFHNPDAANNGGETPESTPAEQPVRKKPRYPRKADDFSAVCLKVADSWKNNPQITLLWLTQTKFQQMAETFASAQTERQSAGGSRQSATYSLTELDEQAETAIAMVKGYIKDKWEKKDAAQAQYARYGIVHVGNNYQLPTDRQKRLAAMEQCANAIAQDGFNNEKYGYAYWMALFKNYDQALTDASSLDGTVSTNVEQKNTLRDDLTEAMDSLQLCIEANYRKMYEGILRDWGWQKEDY